MNVSSSQTGVCVCVCLLSALGSMSHARSLLRCVVKAGNDSERMPIGSDRFGLDAPPLCNSEPNAPRARTKRPDGAAHHNSQGWAVIAYQAARRATTPSLMQVVAMARATMATKGAPEPQPVSTQKRPDLGRSQRDRSWVRTVAATQRPDLGVFLLPERSAPPAPALHR